MKKLFTTLFFALVFSSLYANDSTFYFTTSDHVKLYVRVTGQGKPCVFVHGGPGSTSFYYEAMPGAAMIEKKMKMIYFDQRGAGRSESPANKDYSLKRMGRDMEELRMALGYKKWAVMGHSFGGILITQYAHDYPASTTAFMMIHGTLNMGASMESHIENGLTILGITDRKPFLDPSKSLNERVGMVHNLLSEKDLWYRLMYRNAWEKKFNDSITFSISRFNRDLAINVWSVKEYFNDFSGLTATIKCPVLVMTGAQDYAIGPDHYKSFRFPKSTVVKYIGGHAPFQEEPQWFAEKILTFVARHGL